jgi:isocitrate lyase
MFHLARDYRERGMAAYSELQQAEFAAEAAGYTATRHQREVGVSYFECGGNSHIGRTFLDHSPRRQHRGSAIL